MLQPTALVQLNACCKSDGMPTTETAAPNLHAGSKGDTIASTLAEHNRPDHIVAMACEPSKGGLESQCQRRL